MRERINFWLAILGVVAYLSQPATTTSYMPEPVLSHVIFEN
jgi:hypothetical protein